MRKKGLQALWLKATHIYCLTVFVSQDSRCNLAKSSVQSLFLDCNQDVSWVRFSSEGLSGEGSAFKFTDRVVTRIRFLLD